MPSFDSRNVAVLVGNGLSIAFNPDLNLRAITAEMMDRIQSATDEGNDVVAAMREIAQRALPQGVNSEDDFEMLVGAFGAETRTLSYLDQLAALTEPKKKKLRKAIKRVAAFAERVRDTGLSHVLEVIFERSVSNHEDARNLHAFVEAVTTTFDGKVVFANLNYDTLLLAALLHVCQSDVTDMGHGFRKVRVTTRTGEETEVPALRATASDFPVGRRVQLIHLHGSVTFWSNAPKTIFAKLDRAFLESHDQWNSVREQKTNIRPVVVLANQKDKSAHVEEHPFKLAYEMFVTGLQNADHWLVVGYSFKDDPVNAKLREEFAEREEKPKVLVVTFGDQPSRKEVARAFGWGKEDGSSKSWLTINRDGANGIQNTDDWSDFIA
ncbi:SIR2 family protein [Microbacterium maritypicum]